MAKGLVESKQADQKIFSLKTPLDSSVIQTDLVHYANRLKYIHFTWYCVKVADPLFFSSCL